MAEWRRTLPRASRLDHRSVRSALPPDRERASSTPARFDRMHVLFCAAMSRRYRFVALLLTLVPSCFHPFTLGGSPEVGFLGGTTSWAGRRRSEVTKEGYQKSGHAKLRRKVISQSSSHDVRPSSPVHHQLRCPRLGICCMISDDPLTLRRAGTDQVPSAGPSFPALFRALYPRQG